MNSLPINYAGFVTVAVSENGMLLKTDEMEVFACRRRAGVASTNVAFRDFRVLGDRGLRADCAGT